MKYLQLHEAREDHASNLSNTLNSALIGATGTQLARLRETLLGLTSEQVQMDEVQILMNYNLELSLEEAYIQLQGLNGAQVADMLTTLPESQLRGRSVNIDMPNAARPGQNRFL